MFIEHNHFKIGLWLTVGIMFKLNPQHKQDNYKNQISEPKQPNATSLL